MRVIGNSPASGEGLARCLDVEIDRSIPAIRRAGHEVDLRAKGLRVLLFLFENRHRVVSKEEILEHAWPGINVVDATLAGCVQEIRKALGDDAKEPRFIRTLPKLGYRFIAPVEALQSSPPAQPATKSRALLASLGLSAVIAAGGVWWLLSSRPATIAVDDLAEAAWWKLDERAGLTVKDSSASGLTGTATGGIWAGGRLDGALRLDGVAQQVNGGDPKGLLPKGGAPRSMAAWVKVESTNGDATAIVHFGQEAARNVLDSFRLTLQADGRASFANQGYAGIGSDRSLAVGSQINDGQWHHLAGTFDGRRGALYVDGVPQAAVDMPPATSHSRTMARWAIGNRLGPLGTGFRGMIDDVRIWPRSLGRAEIATLHRCLTGETDLKTSAGREYYFSPLFQTDPARSNDGIRVDQGAIQHAGLDYGGLQLMTRTPGCPTATLRGANVGQDLKISVELLVPHASDGSPVQAGPYFRSRAAGPGDGIIGGRSAGYWVQLHSNGMITVKCLNPAHIVAFSAPVASFDDAQFHPLEVIAVGDQLTVRLDGNFVDFDQAGKIAKTVKIPPDWERPVKLGNNQGTAGIAFSDEPLRRSAGGQQARRYAVEPQTREPRLLVSRAH